MHLRLVGHQLGERPAEPDRLRRELAAAGRIALVEDQVDDREHRVEPLGQQVLGRHPEGDPGGLDLALRPHEPLRHRRLGDQERARDLAVLSPPSVRSVSATCASGASAGWQHGEHELEPLVGERRRVHRDPPALGALEQVGLRGERAIAPDAVDRPVPCGRHQPGARVGGYAVARPTLRGDRERLLRGFLGEVEVAEEADQGREDAPPLVAEDVARGSLPLHDRPHLDRAAHAGRRDPRGQLDRGVEVVGLEEQVAADGLLELDERPVGGQRLAVLHADRRRRRGLCSCWPGVTPGVSLIAW